MMHQIGDLGSVGQFFLIGRLRPLWAAAQDGWFWLGQPISALRVFSSTWNKSSQATWSLILQHNSSQDHSRYLQEWGLDLKQLQSHFHNILLAKASHRGRSDSKRWKKRLHFGRCSLSHVVSSVVTVSGIIRAIFTTKSIVILFYNILLHRIYLDFQLCIN